MQLLGRRRIRSGYPGSVQPPPPVNAPPPPRSIGKRVLWSDHEAFRVRGDCSYLDLELSACASCLVTLEMGAIEGADNIWYSEVSYEQQRQQVKSQFFKRLGSATSEEEPGGEHLSPTWNKLTSYTGRACFHKSTPRMVRNCGSVGDGSVRERADLPRNDSQSSLSDAATVSPGASLRGGSTFWDWAHSRMPPSPSLSEAPSRESSVHGGLSVLGDLPSLSEAPSSTLPSPRLAPPALDILSLSRESSVHGGLSVLGDLVCPRPDAPSPRRGRRGSFTELDTLIGLDHFTIHGLVGEGAFGKVMMVTRIDTQKVYAMKVIRKEDLFTKGELSVTQAITEKQVLQQMASRPHPYVVSLRHAFQTEESICLVMDLIGGGDLYQLLHAKGRLPEGWVVVYAAEIALAIEHVHSHDVIFRDLKPENVMVGMDGHLKLTDFGLSKQLQNSEVLSHAKTICGTPEYIAPEILRGNPYTPMVDWWAYGCLVYEMVHGAAPFISLDMGSLVQLITRCKTKFRPEFCSATLEDLLRKIIVLDLEVRQSSVTALRQHPFFATVDWDALMRKEVAPPCALSEMISKGVEERMPHSKSAVKLHREFTTWSSQRQEDDEGEHSSDERRSSDESPHNTSPHRLSRAIQEQAKLWDVDLSLWDVHEAEKTSTNSSASGSLSHSRPASPQDVNVPGAAAQLTRQPSQGTVLSLHLTSSGTIWMITHALVRSLGYGQVGKPQLLGRSMLDTTTSLVEERDLPKFIDAFGNAREALTLARSASAVSPQTSHEEEMGGDGAVAGDAELTDVTIWLSTVRGGRMCMLCSFALDASYEDAAAGVAGLIVLTMSDVTVAEHNKELVRKRYHLAYNVMAVDADLIDLFSECMEVSSKGMGVQPWKVHGQRLSPTPTAENPSATGSELASDSLAYEELSSGVRLYLERRRVLLRAFPDVHFVTLEQTAQGNQVFTSWQWTGTHLGPYPDGEGAELPASNAHVHVHGISIDVFEHGRIVDHSVFYDEAGIRAQLQSKAKAPSTSLIHATQPNESPIAVRLFLSTRTEHGRNDVVVGATMRPVIATAVSKQPPVSLEAVSVLAPSAPAALLTSAATSEPAASDLAAALGTLESECARLHGRRPTVDEATTLVRKLYANGQLVT